MFLSRCGSEAKWNLAYARNTLNRLPFCAFKMEVNFVAGFIDALFSFYLIFFILGKYFPMVFFLLLHMLYLLNMGFAPF